MSFAEIAEQRLLETATTRLGELQWDVEADPYQRQTFAADIQFDVILQLLPRRGLDPALLNPLFEQLADRPVERALIAWDVARGSLLGRDSGLAQRVATELAPLKALGPASTVAVPRDRVGALIDAVRSSGCGTEPLSLEAVAASTDDALVAAALAHARQLSHAHLPSLALAFVQILWERTAAQPALDFMIEVALDHGMLDAPPVLSGNDARALERGAYVLLRSCSREYDIVNGAKYLESLEQQPAIHGSTDPAFVLAKAELSLLRDETVDRASQRIVERVGSARYVDATGGRWRYAIYVCDAMEMRSGARAPSKVDRFISMFGNNARFWGHAAIQEGAKQELLTLLSREVKFTSHDPEVWRAVSILVSDGESIDTEVDARLAAQLTEAFA
jgi:hypothetical protein